MHGVIRVLREAALWVVAVLGSVSILVAVAAVAFGVTPLIFRSGSMAPGIPTGSLGLAQSVDASQLQLGDVVSVVWSDGTRVTHRVTGIEPFGDAVKLETKGDANAQADVERPVVSRVDRVFWSVPGAGYAFQELAKPYWVFGSGVIVGAIVVLTLVRPARSAPDERPGAPDDATGSPRRGAVAALAAGVLVVSAALIPQPTATLAAFTDAGTARTALGTGAVPAVPEVRCEVLGGLLDLKSVRLSWDTPSSSIGPITSYRVSGSGIDQVVTGNSITIPPGLLSIGTLTFTVQSRYGTWLSPGVSRQVLTVTSLLVVTCL